MLIIYRRKRGDCEEIQNWCYLCLSKPRPRGVGVTSPPRGTLGVGFLAKEAEIWTIIFCSSQRKTWIERCGQKAASRKTNKSGQPCVHRADRRGGNPRSDRRARLQASCSLLPAPTPAPLHGSPEVSGLFFLARRLKERIPFGVCG